MTRRILVTGSRKWTDWEPIRLALLQAWSELGCKEDTVLVVGACPTGADAIAEEIWRRVHLPVERHAADWDRLGKAAGPIRNHEMAKAGADVCLAFVDEESRGTKDCIRRAEQYGIPVRQFRSSPLPTPSAGA